LTIYLLPLLAPAALITSAAFCLFDWGRRPRFLLKLTEAAALFAVLVSLVSGVLLVLQGPGVSPLLVSFIGWVVVRYATTYLDGEARQGAFMGWLSLTLACVLLLVLSGNLVQLVVAWVATSLFLHRLLLFYPNRLAA
jgi:NAD(P)H-quinone oxidoreductase subunit 5